MLQSSIALKRPFQAMTQNYWRSLSIGLTIVSTMLLGLMRLPEPLWGDQALFLVGGQAIHDGALLYRDFWDLKQPGIYGLYALGGTLFGFNSVGVHGVDLIWMGTLAIVLGSTLRSAFSRSWIALLLPWICVGTYFATIDLRHQMQVESLVGLPLYLVIWFNVQAVRQPAQRWRWLMLSGIAGGGVLLLKLIYLPLLLSFWGVYLGHQVYKQRSPFLRTVWQTSWPLAIGMALPLLPVVMYWWVTGTLDLAIDTQLVHPPKMLQILSARPLGHLVAAVSWVVLHFWPTVFLGAYGLGRLGKRLDLLTLQLAVWLGLGLLMIVAQRPSWWSYHFLLLLVPMSILAAHGLDALLAVRRGRKRARSLVAIAISGFVLMNLMAVVDMGPPIVRSGWPIGAASQLQYQILKSPLYVEAAEEVAFVQRPQALPGKIYVIGNPVFYLLSGRSQAVPLNGWIPEILLPAQWQQLTEQLAAAQPNYLYANHEYAKYWPPQMDQFLQARYVAVQQSQFGTWYQIKSGSGATVDPQG